MLVRFVSIIIALVTTLLAFAVYIVLFHSAFDLFGAWTQLLLITAQLAIAIYLCARFKSWPALLLLVGSIPMVLLKISYCGFVSRMDHAAHYLAWLFPSDQELSPIKPLLAYSQLLIFCLPVALFCVLWQGMEAHLTKR